VSNRVQARACQVGAYCRICVAIPHDTPFARVIKIHSATSASSGAKGYSLVNNTILLARFACQTEAWFDSFVIPGDSG
jgi:hypothetical protein